MLREIKLYGQLAKFVGHRKLQAAVSNAAEAIRFLLANFPGLDQHMVEHNYKVLAGNYALDAQELHDPAGMQAIKIVPVIAGAGGSVGKILTGVALVAAAIIIGPAAGGFLGLGAGLGGATGAGAAISLGLVGGTFATAVGAIGAALILGGVAQALSPTPKASALNTVGGIGAGFGAGGGGGGGGGSDPRDSYSFNAVQNVSRQGVPVPIIFGEVICGSVTVSAGIDIAQKKG